MGDEVVVVREKEPVLKLSKKKIRLESYKDKLNWGMAVNHDEEQAYEVEGQELDLSILSSGDEDLIQCMTTLQVVSGGEDIVVMVEEPRG